MQKQLTKCFSCKRSLNHSTGLPASLRNTNSVALTKKCRCVKSALYAAMCAFKPTDVYGLFQLRELSHRLKAANDAIMQLRDNNSHLEGNGAEMKNIASTLEAQLRFAEQEMQAMSAGEAVGAGLSELNPALMEEVTRLRHENEQLLLKVVLFSELLLWLQGYHNWWMISSGGR